MIIRPVSFVAAEGVAIDQLTGRLTAFNMVDHIAVPGFPAQLLRLVAISFYDLDNAPHGFSERVRLIGPTGDPLVVSNVQPVALTVRVPGQMPNGIRSIQIIWRAIIAIPGDHRLLLEQQAAPDGPWETAAIIYLPALVEPNPFINSGLPQIAPTPTPGHSSQK